MEASRIIAILQLSLSLHGSHSPAVLFDSNLICIIRPDPSEIHTYFDK